MLGKIDIVTRHDTSIWFEYGQPIAMRISNSDLIFIDDETPPEFIGQLRRTYGRQVQFVKKDNLRRDVLEEVQEDIDDFYIYADVL